MNNQKIVLPSKLEVLEDNGEKGKFVIKGLNPGYGHTLGNSLRRIILSSIEGVGITLIKIDGVPHEFSTIEGVKEDVINIILNLKRVIFRTTSEEELTVNLTAKKGEVTANDIDAPSQIEVMNKDTYLFTVTGDKDIEIEFIVKKGLGYVPKEDLVDDKLPAGSIVMDTSFTPIRRASYTVENMMVGKRTDYNKIMFSIETDGTIDAVEVMNKSLEIMREQISAIIEGSDEEIIIDEPEKEEILVTSLNISEKLLEKIIKSSIKTVDDLDAKSDAELLAIDGIGQKAISDLRDAVNKIK
jgi:DNA-directed RNA polymerase subunit alpha